MAKETNKFNSPANKDFIKSIKELLGNNEYAISAIQSRNKKIRNLEAIIEHHKVAFDEIERRYDDLTRRKNTSEEKLFNLEKDYVKLYKDWEKVLKENKELEEYLKKIENDLKIIKRLRDKTFAGKIENYANKVGGKRGALIKLLFTPPVSKIVLLVIFIIITSASLVGWGPIIAAIKPIFRLFY